MKPPGTLQVKWPEARNACHEEITVGKEISTVIRNQENVAVEVTKENVSEVPIKPKEQQKE